MIRTGGPNPAEAPQGGIGVRQVANLVTGKNTVGDIKREREEQEQKSAAALAKAREVIMNDSAGVSSAPKTASRGPPLPPKRVSATTELSNSLKSFKQPTLGQRTGPPIPPQRFTAPIQRSGPPPLPKKSVPPTLPKKGAPPPPPKKAAAAPKSGFVTALFDNVPDDTDELAFSAGDKIEVLKKDPSGWWEGRIGSKKGIFPANFVKE